MHLALAHGALDGSRAPLVRVHVADTLRDLLGVRSDAAAWTLRAAMERIAQAGSGVVVVLREQESPRELADAMRTGCRARSGRAARARRIARCCAPIGVGAQILKDLGVRRMRVLSAPKQMHGISAFDLEVEGYVGEDA